MDQPSLQPNYLSQLRDSGIFTEGDFLELEDHFYTIYEVELDNGKPASMALQRAEQALGKREEVIAAFAQKRKWAWAKDLGSFFVFGLVVNLLGLWCLGIGVGNLSAIIVYGTNLENLAPILIPAMMISFILFIASWQWRLIRQTPASLTKLPSIFERLKLKYVLLILLLPLVFSSISDPLIYFVSGNHFITPWGINEIVSSIPIWAYFYNFSITAMTAFYGWQAYQNYQQNKGTEMLWSLRFGIFFMAGLSLPMISLLNNFLLEILPFSNYDNLLHWFISINQIMMGIEIGLMLCFPFAYRHIWKRKQYMA